MAMKTKFLLSSSSVSVVKINDQMALDYLPAQVYSLQFSPISGYYLRVVKAKLQIPSKIYGNANTRVNKCISTYLDRESSTGVLLTGDKGTGKTLFMSILSNRVIEELELPVILIKQAYGGEQFLSFIESIGECCLVFDEFAKMYSDREDNPSQTSVLTLMDGVDKTKRLILVTENFEYNINEFMLNRPSRIYYHWRYTKLDEDSINEFCREKKVPDSIYDEIIDLARRSRIFSFDMLQSIVTEYLRFNNPIEEIISDLNIDIRREYAVDIEILKVVFKPQEIECQIISGVVPKPIDDSSRITLIMPERLSKGISGEPVAPPVQFYRQEGFLVDVDDDAVNSPEVQVYIDVRCLKYEIAGQLVYEKEGFLITARERASNYANYRDLV